MRKSQLCGRNRYKYPYYLIIFKLITFNIGEYKMDYKKRNYLICVIILLAVFLFINGFMLFGEMNPSDSYITPGAARIEWLFAGNMIFVAIFVSGILSLYLAMPGFTKLFVKTLGKKQQIGLVPEEELNSKNHLLRLWGRSLVLGFFIANICYTLSANEAFVTFMLTDIGEAEMKMLYGGQLLIPDPSTMLQIMWMLSIPLTLIVVPIWFLMDVGLVSAKKVKGVNFSSVNLTTSKIYKIIKGYAGIGFTYSLLMMLMDWAFARTYESELINIAVQFSTPLVIICSVFPLVLLMDNQKARFRKKFEKTIIKLNMNKDLKCTVELIDRR